MVSMPACASLSQPTCSCMPVFLSAQGSAFIVPARAASARLNSTMLHDIIPMILEIEAMEPPPVLIVALSNSQPEKKCLSHHALSLSKPSTIVGILLRAEPPEEAYQILCMLFFLFKDPL